VQKAALEALITFLWEAPWHGGWHGSQCDSFA
jgi:hypothetical protein